LRTFITGLQTTGYGRQPDASRGILLLAVACSL
jgi:hypothetical protein